MGKIKKQVLTPMQGSAVEGTRFKFPQVGDQLGMHQVSVNNRVRRFVAEGFKGLETRPGKVASLLSAHGTGNHPAGHRERPLLCLDCQGAVGEGNRKGSLRRDPQTFFKGIGTRFGRIRKHPKGKPSPQLCQYKLWELQESGRLWHDGSIELYYGDESHLCEDACVPYGWKFHEEDIYIPSQRGARLNCLAMIEPQVSDTLVRDGKQH